jgi:putative flippase GtrA
VRPQAREVALFGVVGLTAYAVDVGVFNLLLLGLGLGSAVSKVLSSAAAIAVAFAGSRWLTWREHRGGRRPAQQYALFLGVSVVAAGIQLLCLLVSRELLGFRSPVADNVSGNVIGMALATAFRFWGFRTVVFPPRADLGSDREAPERR